MILTALERCYHRLAEHNADIPAFGFAPGKISYALVLDRDGNLIDVTSTQLPDAKGKMHPRAINVPAWSGTRTSGIRANFLWDKTSYVLGVSAVSKRVDQKHGAFKALHLEALAQVDDEGLLAVRRFLERWDPAQLESCVPLARIGEAIFDTNLVFRLEGSNPRWIHDRHAAREVWSRLRTPDVGDTEMTCLVSGELVHASRLHPEIKGVDGAQSSGAPLVSFNDDAFTSYGKKRGDNAPVSEAAAFAYTTALNYLLRRGADNRQRLQLGDTTVVFWAEAPDKDRAEAAEDLIALCLTPPQQSDARETRLLQDALAQVARGRPLRHLDAGLDDATRIHILGLAPNAARLSIRFWQTGSLASFSARLGQHFRDLELRPSPRNPMPSAWALALATAPSPGQAKPKMDDVSPLLAGELLRAILAGTRYPQSLLANLVMRFRADGKLTATRIALVKAVLVRSARLGNHAPSAQGGDLVSLDLEDNHPGYLLGRLFATLEGAQYFALGGKTNATIRDRYYGAASATPANIFPVLLRGVQNHLGKLRKTKTGLAVNLEKQLADIINRLPPEFPRHLDMDGQGRFAIGYYHQQHAGRGTPAERSDLDGENA